MNVLLLSAFVLIGSLTMGSRTFAAKTGPRAANALLLMVVGTGRAAWLLSEAWFDAGL